MFQDAPISLPPPMRDSLRAAYQTPVRAYHNLEHIAEVHAYWQWINTLGLWRDAPVTWLALLFHDAIYEPGRRDNEAMSAALARHEIEAYLGTELVDIERVCQLIEWTAGHGRHHRADLDADACLFLDCDMAILGAESSRFDAYDSAIAEEYRDVLPAWMFRFNRRRFLKRLLDTDRIYLSELFVERFERPARANLKRALASRSALQAGAGR